MFASNSMKQLKELSVHWIACDLHLCEKTTPLAEFYFLLKVLKTAATALVGLVTPSISKYL